MNQKLLNQMLTINEIQSEIKASKTLTEALEKSFKVLLDKGYADYIVAWYKEENDSDVLAPVLWVCPKDITLGRYRAGEGCVGKAFESKTAVNYLDYKNGMDPVTDQIFGNLEIGSAFCVPIETLSQDIGCIQYLNKTTGDQLTEDSADVYEILTLLISMAINENEDLHSDKELKKVFLMAKDIEKEFVNGDIVTKVLKGVDINIFEGEFVVILGESGCGKSTFLNVISGMDTATSGTFKFRDEDLSGADESALTEYRRNNIGFIFQSYNLMPNLTAKQNLELIANLVENPMDVEEALDLVGLLDRKDNYPSQLSGGQQQRVSIARALVKNTPLIFADEPTAALDYATSIEVLTALENIIGKGTTLVMVTHNEEIAKMADRVVRMRNGRAYKVTVNRHPSKAVDLVW